MNFTYKLKIRLNSHAISSFYYFHHLPPFSQRNPIRIGQDLKYPVAAIWLCFVLPCTISYLFNFWYS